MKRHVIPISCKYGKQTTVPLIALLVSVRAAVAADVQGSEGAVLEEITVTAQRRSENLQEVPIAVTPLTGQELEARGIAGLAGLTTGAVPSLNLLRFAGSPAELQYSIRGIGETDTSQPSFESGVALYVDGVYIARRQGTGVELTDLEEIEVLRGPQGTLFGRNAVGGAVNVVTKKPTGEWGFKALLEQGNFDERREKATLNTAAWAGLSFKFDYLHSERGGITKNVASGQEDWGSNAQNSFRIAARWRPVDSVIVDYAYDDTRLSYVENYNQLVHNTTVPVISDVLAPFVEPDRNDGHVLPPGLYAPKSRTLLDGHSLTAQWDVREGLMLKSISAYREMHNYDRAANGFGILAPSGASPPSPIFLGNVIPHFDLVHHQSSQEFQLIGQTSRWKYAVGAVYFNEKGTAQSYSELGLGYFATAPGQFTAALLPQTIVTPPTTTDVDSTSIGLYTQETWTPPIAGDRLHLTGGLRYSDDDKKLRRTALLGVPSDVPVRVKASRVDPAATAAFDVAEDVSTYARYATAYRGGGASLRETPYTAAEDPRGIGDPLGFHGFGPEEIKSYEMGFKSEFLAHRVRFNGAVFYSDLKGKQLSFQTPAGVASTRVLNLSDTIVLKGAEFELTVVPFRGLTLNAGVTWLKQAAPATVPNPITGEDTAFRISQYPANRYSAGVQYDFKPLSIGTLSARVNVSGSSSYCFNDVSCTVYADVAGGKNNDLVDARVTLSDVAVKTGALQFALWGRNLTDRKWYQYGFTVPGLDTGVISYGDPRTYGASVTYEF